MRWLPFLLTILPIAPGGLTAAEMTGAATPIGAKFCRADAADPDSLRCPGPSGTDAFLQTTDERAAVSLGDPNGFVGFDAASSLGTTMEWRLENGRPFAGIVRYRLAGEAAAGSRGDLLAILKVAEGERPGCLVAVVDMTVNPEGRAMARRIADERVAAFTCGADEARIVGMSSDWARAIVLPAL